jgi:hypothetical protein
VAHSGTRERSMGVAKARVRRQAGVDSTVAAVLMELGQCDSVASIFVFTGDKASPLPSTADKRPVGGPVRCESLRGRTPT